MLKAVNVLVCFLLPFSLALPVEQGQINVEHEDFDTITILPVRDTQGHVKFIDLSSEKITLKASEKDVTYRLYTKQNVEDGEIVTKENITKSKYFDSKRKTVFISHGWRNNYNSSININVKGTLLELNDLNVIVVDWSGPANSNYFTAQAAVTVVGATIGGFINNLVANNSVELEKVIIIGHSLGAHVAGNAGAAVKGRVSVILGLDAARPLFTYENIDNRLDPTDAEYVYVIHTSGGLLGFQKPIGHCDFFPHGGYSQPGCGLDLDGTCAHSRAYEYYVESLKSDKFVAYECDTYPNFRKGSCKDNKKATMGGFTFSKNLTGSFYLDVNYKPPFAKG